MYKRLPEVMMNKDDYIAEASGHSVTPPSQKLEKNAF